MVKAGGNELIRKDQPRESLFRKPRTGPRGTSWNSATWLVENRLGTGLPKCFGWAADLQASRGEAN